MSFINKFIVSGLTFGLAVCLNTASYAAEPENQPEKTSDEDAILFRVENIKPLANEDGLTDRCSFLVTVYNRMDKKVESIDMDFRWKDTIAKKYRIIDDDVKVVDDPKDAETYIMKHIDLENILPHQQKSFENVVATDKCYLLLDQIEYKVNNCIAEGDKIQMKNSMPQNKGSCIERFNYINSKNPEYYSEFKDVPDSVLEQQAEEAKKQELSGIENAYQGALENLEKVSAQLDKIVKFDPEKIGEEELSPEDENAEEDKDSKDKDKDKDKKSDESAKADKSAKDVKADKEAKDNKESK